MNSCSRFMQAVITGVFLLAALAVRSVLSSEITDGMRRVSLRTHTLSAPFLDDSLHSRWFDFGGDAIIRTDKYIRLTTDRPSQAGWIFSRLPLTASSFQIEVEFEISGKGNLYGDGMALWLTKEREGESGAVFGAHDKFEGLGVFIDTYKNNRPGTSFPYIMAMVGDGSTKYTKENDGKDVELAGCSARGLHNPSIKPSKLRLTYIKDDFLRLDIQYKDRSSWTNCFDVPAPNLPTISYLGFSAETGELSENHDLISVSVDSLIPTSSNPNNKEANHHVRVPPSFNSRAKRNGNSRGFFSRLFGFFWFLIKVGIFCGVAYFGYLKYRTYQKNQQFKKHSLL
ncbi:concanavalin A-like lectin/glucanase domain-containing protein [Dipodascopsis uninucleata]